jgi:hypothetical protein
MIGDYEPLIAAAVEQLDPSLEEYLRDQLEALLVLSPDDPTRVESFVAPGTSELLDVSVESGADSERRLRLEDAARSAFRSAGTPLSLAAVTDRVRQRIDADESALAALLCQAPFVQRNADQYGLLARDVPGGPDAIARAINTVLAMLETNQRPLPARQAFVIVQARIKQSWSYELLCSLLCSDPALRLSPSEDLTLRRWGQAQPHDPSDLCCPSVPSRARACFDALRRQPPGSRQDLARRVRTLLNGLERSDGSDDLSVLALARHLGDVYERLLDYAESGSPGVRQLAHAAVRFFIEAPGIDEDDDEPAIDRDHLADARTVLAAVLEQLESSPAPLRSVDEVPPLLRWLG